MNYLKREGKINIARLKFYSKNNAMLKYTQLMKFKLKYKRLKFTHDKIMFRVLLNRYLFDLKRNIYRK